MKTYIIERDLPGVGTMSDAEISAAVAASNAALARLAPRLQWQHSFIARNKTFCVYLAQDAHAIREHADISGLPATSVSEILNRIDPTSGTPS